MYDGEVKIFWPNGQCKRSVCFDRGVRHGADRMWNEEGRLVDEGFYNQNKPIGVHRRWGAEGNLIEEIQYEML